MRCKEAMIHTQLNILMYLCMCCGHTLTSTCCGRTLTHTFCGRTLTHTFCGRTLTHTCCGRTLTHTCLTTQIKTNHLQGESSRQMHAKVRHAICYTMYIHCMCYIEQKEATILMPWTTYIREVGSQPLQPKKILLQLHAFSK